MPMQQTGFWTNKPLPEMSKSEWESLCDGCGKCCVLKLEDVDSGEIFSTDVGCRLLNCENARCMNYDNRQIEVPDCVVLTPDNLSYLSWMPKSCAYRLVHEGSPLPDWHPLISGRPDSVREANISVAGRILPEAAVEETDLIDHIVNWDESFIEAPEKDK